MNTRKSLKLPIIITFIFICIIVYLFMNIKQTKIVCSKNQSFDSNIKLQEVVTATIDNKQISSLVVYKKITLPEEFSHKEQNIKGIKNSLEHSLDYLGKKVTFETTENSVIAYITVNKDELVLLDNINIIDNNGELGIDIDVNVKSSNVISLSVGDNYTDGELMKRLRNNGYSCK